MRCNTSNKRLHILLCNIGQYISGKDINIFRNYYLKILPENRMKQMSIIQTFLNNNYFTVRQLLLYCLYNLITDEKFLGKIHTWDFKHIDEISKLFTKERLQKDIALINNLIGKSGVTNLFDTVILNSSGEMIALELLKAKYISPIFVIRFKDKIVRKSEPSIETERMLRIVDAIEQVLKTELI